VNPPTIDVSALTNVATLSTPRLRLEPLGIAHFDGVWEGLFDEETLRLTGTRQTFTREAVVRHLESLAARDDRADWAIIDLETEQYVGEIVLNELNEDDASINFRIMLAPGHPGRGFGTEATRAILDYAFDRIGLHRVELDVYSFNPRAQRSYEKAGFRYEGRQRDTLFWDGEWVDSILMAVLSTDERPAAPSAGGDG
jgi:RimJ/RimL family protein N-acetyltransferase